MLTETIIEFYGILKILTVDPMKNHLPRNHFKFDKVEEGLHQGGRGDTLGVRTRFSLLMYC